MNVLVLLTDAFGGNGGIAQFNRHLLSGLCGHPAARQVRAVPRVVPDAVGALPAKLHYATDAAAGRLRYIRSVVTCLTAALRYDLVICGHIHLLPLAWIVARRHRAPLVLVLHGIEAWRPPANALARRLVLRVDRVVAVSELTRQRFLEWSALDPVRSVVVPNCVDASCFAPGPKRSDLLERYGLTGKRILLTVGRLAASERYKGVDEVMQALAALATTVPDVGYLVVGDGDDRPRLESQAHELGVAERVVFAGRVPEAEKADHYRLADVFVMPGRGEGFGIVYLEALASGLPVVGSKLDGSREALMEGRLGILVDPDRPEELRRALVESLARTSRDVPVELGRFSPVAFERRWHEVVDHLLANRTVRGDVARREEKTHLHVA